MPTQEEKTAFAARLLFLLKHNAPSIKGPTSLANAFNLRYTGEGVSLQTAHKWLTGQSLPALDKTRVLAEWLGISEHWLRYGPPPQNDTGDQRKKLESPLSEEMRLLASRIQALSEQQQYLMMELVGQFEKTIT